jgi:hypothetical protein
VSRSDARTNTNEVLQTPEGSRAFRWNLHEEDDREVIVYVAVADWEVEVLFCNLGQKCMLVPVA